MVEHHLLPIKQWPIKQCSHAMTSQPCGHNCALLMFRYQRAMNSFMNLSLFLFAWVSSTIQRQLHIKFSTLWHAWPATHIMYCYDTNCVYLFSTDRVLNDILSNISFDVTDTGSQASMVIIWQLLSFHWISTSTLQLTRWTKNYIMIFLRHENM